MTLGGRCVGAMPAQRVLDLILQIELALLQRDFFELFGCGEEGVRKLTDTLVEAVVLDDQLPEGRVGLGQLVLQLLCFNCHAPPPVRKFGTPYRAPYHRGRSAARRFPTIRTPRDRAARE